MFIFKSRRERERLTVNEMIKLYCSLNHRGSLCNDCRKLINYSDKRLEKCPFKDEKPVCSECTVHCYRKEEREQIRRVMRFPGPRMTLSHPIMAVFHLIDKKKP